MQIQEKKTILHFIYDLGRGGAEMMMVKVIRELKEYNNIVVTIIPKNHFGAELECDKLYCLNLKSILLFPKGAIQLRRIINKHKVDLVHSHLFWPTIIARMGTPKKIPLLTTIHAFIATSVEYKIWYIRFLDKLTYRIRKNVIIAVAQGAKQQYFDFLHLKPYKAYSLYTFVDLREFNDSRIIASPGKSENFRLISVGALRIQKNLKYLLEAFTLLKNEKFELDVYGAGPLFRELQRIIDERGLKVNLKGEVRDIAGIMRHYDLFAMCSTFEGFSLSVLEAMAMKMPLLLSDIESFREQCVDTAIFFDLNNVNDFVDKLRLLSKATTQLSAMGERARQRAIDNFTIEQHMNGLRKIYSENI